MYWSRWLASVVQVLLNSEEVMVRIWRGQIDSIDKTAEGLLMLRGERWDTKGFAYQGTLFSVA